MAIDLVMPRLSDSMEEGTIVRWLKQPGDAVSAGEPLAEVETDKATVTYAADADGVLLEILVEEGGRSRTTGCLPRRGRHDGLCGTAGRTQDARWAGAVLQRHDPEGRRAGAACQATGQRAHGVRSRHPLVGRPGQGDTPACLCGARRMFGVRAFSAIVNPPQAAILSVGELGKRAVVADAAEFLGRIRALLERPLGMAL